MFHIKPWMRSLPAFKDQPSSKKNHKESLRTANLSEALGKMTRRLSELDLYIDPSNNELADRRPFVKALLDEHRKSQREPSPKQEYFDNLTALELLSLEGLDNAEDAYTDVLDQGFEEGNHDKNAALGAIYDAEIKAINRVRAKEDDKLEAKAHPFAFTLTFSRDRLLKRYEVLNKHRSISKLKAGVSKFIELIGQEDIQMIKISEKLVSRYVDNASSSQIPRNTFSSELSQLNALWDHARKEELIPRHESPFRGHSLSDLKKPLKRHVYDEDILLALIETAKDRLDVLAVLYISYYTGSRISEIFDCTLEERGNLLILNIKEDGGKTEAARRLLPAHPHLKEWLTKNGFMPDIGKCFNWPTKSSDALDKRFTRFKNTFLDARGLGHLKKHLVHHSFRHTFITNLLNAGLNELQAAVLAGQSSGTVGRTEAGKTYYHGADLKQKYEQVCLIPALQYA